MIKPHYPESLLINFLRKKRNVQCSAEMTVVDSMSLVRKLPMKKMGLDTLEDMAECLSNIILATSSESTRIDIFLCLPRPQEYNFFDVYQNSSIEQIEGVQRNSSEQITITIRSDNKKFQTILICSEDQC